MLLAVGGFAGCLLSREIVMRYVINRTIRKVHEDVLKRIMNAPINTFFDVTPSGSIMNRFTVDMRVLEEILQLIISCVHCAIEYMHMFVLVGWVSPKGLLILPLLYAYYYYIWSYSNKAKRQSLQIMHNLQVPVVTHRGEIMSGCPTIRAFDSVNFAIEADIEN